MPYFVLYAFMTLVFISCVWLKRNYSYWERRGVNGPTPWPIFGNVSTIIFTKESVHDYAKRLYQDYPDERVVGFYQGLTPALLIRDPELIKHITIKDYESFNSRGMRWREDKYDDNLFQAEGKTWKTLRQKFNPSFTSSKVKKMMLLGDACVENFTEHVERLITSGNTEQDARQLSRLFAIDVNGRCCFGTNLNVYGNKIEKQNASVDMIEEILTSAAPVGLAKFIQIVFPKAVKYLYQISGGQRSLEKRTLFFNNLIENIMTQRDSKLETYGDIMDVIIEFKTQENIGNSNAIIATDHALLTAQAMTFFVGGSEPTSLFLSFLLFEMALHQDMQQRLYEEICQTTTKYNGKVTHDSVKHMPYLNMIFEEVLRRHPSSLSRKCLQSYTFPDFDLTIEKGTAVLIPVPGLHQDPKYYKDPETFDPERFSPENRKDIPSSVYLPFGDGARRCIASQLGRMQCLVGAAGLLQKYRVHTTDRSPKGPLTMDPRHITPRSLQSLWIGIARR